MTTEPIEVVENSSQARRHSARSNARVNRHFARARLVSWFVRNRGDVLGIAAIVILIVLFLSPAVIDGGSFGGFDLDTGAESSLGSGLFHVFHSAANGDAVSQMVSWNALDWRLIHHGSFPLWNEYSVLGMPQFLNFESSVLSLPDIVSYAVPIQYAFLVVVAMKFLIAGSGVYVLCRVLRLRPSSATFGGVTFMFAGAFAGWITWPLSDVVAWTGWICALALLCYHAPNGYRYVPTLAVAVAFSIYGGFPEANVMVVMTIGAAIIVGGLAFLVARQRLSPLGLMHCLVGVLSGVGLAAPLWYAGKQIIDLGHRQADGHYVGLPIRTLSLAVSQGFFGLPIGPNATFQIAHWNYYESVAYVGVIAVLLVVVAIVASQRRILVLVLVAGLLVSLVATYQTASFHPFENIINNAGELSAIRFERMRIVTAFFVAVLAAIGCDCFLTRMRYRIVRRAYFLGTVVVCTIVGALIVVSVRDHLKDPALTQRFDALIWPCALIALTIVVGVVIAMTRDFTSDRAQRRITAAVFGLLFVGQASFLFFAGVGIPSYSKHFYSETPAEQELRAIVGNKLLGLDGGNITNVRAFHHIGFYPNVNIGYGIRLFGAHDPLIPAAYFSSWPVAGAGGSRGVGLFVPDVNTAALARRYGISYLIAPPGSIAPPGTTLVAVLNGEELFQVPNAKQFAFIDRASGAEVLSVTDQGNGNYVLHVKVAQPTTLVLRVTAVPGWHLSSNGKSIALHTYQGVMQRATIPGGSHVLVMHYFPPRLGQGIKAAIAAGAFLLLWCLAFGLRQRRRWRSAADRAIPLGAPAGA